MITEKKIFIITCRGCGRKVHGYTRTKVKYLFYDVVCEYCKLQGCYEGKYEKVLHFVKDSSKTRYKNIEFLEEITEEDIKNGIDTKEYPWILAVCCDAGDIFSDILTTIPLAKVTAGGMSKIHNTDFPKAIRCKCCKGIHDIFFITSSEIMLGKGILNNKTEIVMESPECKEK